MDIARILLPLCLFIPFTLQAQTINGKVTDDKSLPLPGVLIRIEPLGKVTLSDSEGNFGPVELPENIRLQITSSLLGYGDFDTLLFSGKESHYLTLVLRERSLDLEEVVVLGRENKGGLGSSTEIGRQAIAHVQPNSLRDVLQLLPGQLAINPDVNSPQQILIRHASVNASGNTVAQLGTAVVLDGSPISNDGNLQYDVTILNSSPGSSPPFQSVANQGVDLRQIPADQIEKVEVIRGVAPVRHGNFTSGAVLVETRIGKFDPEFRIRANPNAFQTGFGAGFQLVPSKQAFSVDLDYMDSKPDPRDILNSYSRVTANVGYEAKELFGKALQWRTRFTLSGNVATRREDQGNDPAARAWQADDQAVRINNSINYRPHSGWVDRLEATVSFNYTRQNAFYQEFITTNVGPRPTFLYDSTGAVPYGTARYLNETTVDGKVFNYYHRIEGVKTLKTGNLSHLISFGSEWRHDRNRGAGRQFDLTRPPRQNYNAGDRPRSFEDVPGLNQISVYAEDRFSSRLLDKPFFWQAGVRADHYFLSNPTSKVLGTHLQPRVNILWDFHQKVSFRGSYGVLSKVPGLNYLSPGPRFIDLINFNHYAPEPSERLLLVTTRRIDLPDGQVSPFLSKKLEFGFEGQLAGIDFNLTAFREFTPNGPGFIREPYLARRGIYEVLENIPGQPPVVSPQPATYDTLFLAYDHPVNNQEIKNIGLEYTINFPEIKSLKTTLNLMGALLRTTAKTNGQQVDPGFIFRFANNPYVPVYRAGTGNLSNQWNSSFRLIHRIPEAGLVISSLVQVIWIQSDRPVGYDPLPVALVNRAGETVSLTPEQASLPEYQIYRRDALESHLLPEQRPPLWLVNLRLNKEFGRGRGFAFYVNNIFNHRPLYQSVRTDLYSQRNIPLFFGAEIFFKL